MSLDLSTREEQGFRGGCTDESLIPGAAREGHVHPFGRPNELLNSLVERSLQQRVIALRANPVRHAAHRLHELVELRRSAAELGARRGGRIESLIADECTVEEKGPAAFLAAIFAAAKTNSQGEDDAFKSLYCASTWAAVIVWPCTGRYSVNTWPAASKSVLSCIGCAVPFGSVVPCT